MGKKRRRSKRLAPTNATATATTSIDAYGRVPKKDWRAFNALLNLMILLNMPQMEEHRQILQGATYIPLGYDTRGLEYNSSELRDIVINFLLMNIGHLASEIEEKKHDRQILAARGKLLTADELLIVKSWTVHIQDDFLVVDHIPNKGAVFVQLGRVRHHDLQREREPTSVEGDIHEPRISVVRSLDTPIQQLLSSPEKMFSAEHPVVHEFPELKVAYVYTTLVPFGDGIQCISGMIQPTMQHLDTPLDYDSAIRLAAESYRSAFSNSKVEPSSPGVKLYMQLHPDEDVAIFRLTSDVRNVTATIARASRFVSDRARPPVDGLQISVRQSFWNPYYDVSQPPAPATVTRVVDGDRPCTFESVKVSADCFLTVYDGETCPLHRRVGADTVVFRDCCKNVFLQWLEAKKDNKLALVFEPIDKDDLELFVRAGITKFTPEQMRLGNIDPGRMQITFEPLLSAIIKDRLDHNGHFEAIKPYMWAFLGDCIMRVGDQGVMVFGDVILHPSTGKLTCETKSVKRMADFAKHIKDVCSDLDILSVLIQSTPMSKSKPDLEGFDRIRAAFQEGLESVEVTTDVNKAINKHFRKRCAYCADTENKSLKRCMCKAVYYCGKQCQGPHWKEHAKLCKEIRKVASAATS